MKIDRNTTVIRSATIADTAAIARLHLLTQRQAYQSFLPASYLGHLWPKRDQKRWERYFRKHEGFILVVEEKSVGIVGFAAVLVDTATYVGFPAGFPRYRAGLESLYVHPSFQNQHLGAYLLRAVCEVLLGSGITTLETWVYADNPALAWYDKHGAEYIRSEYVVVGTTHLERLNLGWPDIRRLFPGTSKTGRATSQSR